MFEIMLGVSQRVRPETPGSNVLLAGTETAGYYGEVSASYLIDGLALASLVGVNQGVVQNTTAPWLKFSLDDKIVYVAKRTFRSAISYSELNNSNVVDGSKIITVEGQRYKVRLLKGRNESTGPIVNGSYDHSATHGCEWNRLMYHVSASPNRGSMSSEGISVGDWAQYSDADLCVAGVTGSASWCSGIAGGLRIGHGYRGSSYLFVESAGLNNSDVAWRPVLELVE